MSVEAVTHDLTPADLLVKAAMCYRMAWYLRSEPYVAWELMRRGDEAMAAYDELTAPVPPFRVAPAPRLGLIERLGAIRWGPDALS